MASLNCGGRPLSLDGVAIMGILNVTPDSFSDGGLFVGLDEACRHAEAMALAGADIIDIGGESTRPGAQPVSMQQELDRVIPVIEKIVGTVDIPLSIDTTKPEVMAEAVNVGAGLINDVLALRAPGAMEVVASLEVPVCLMHMQGEPRTMQENPYYNDVVTDVRSFLEQRIHDCVAQGIDRGRILIDPGFGFGKTVAHNLELLRNLDTIAALGVPVIAGLSRKSMIGKLLDIPVEKRLPASITLGLLAILHGAKMLRVHDVAETVQAVRMYEAVVAEN